MGGRGGGGGGKGGGMRRGSKEAGAFLKKATSLYKSGQSLSQIAKATGKSSSTVHKHLVSGGVQLRPRGGSSRPSRG